jgi:hypothetical protein
MEQLDSHWKEFHQTLYKSIFLKSVDKIQVSLKSGNNNGPLYEEQSTFVIVSHSFLFVMKSVLGNICTENQNTHFVVNNFFRQSCLL